MNKLLAALVLMVSGCALYGDDEPAPADASVDAPESLPDAELDCCRPACPSPQPECCTGPDDPRPVCEMN